MNRGDIYQVALDPTVGHEQSGRRPVLLVSSSTFNRATRVPIVLPITSGGAFARKLGFAVPLTGLKTTGVVRCDQPRALDVAARGGKMIFVHGMADPIFSAFDTIRYVEQLRERYGAEAAGFSRLFLVPGMNHCAGGPATDQYDTLSALDAWVESGSAPDKLIATARNAPDVPWPGRTRPLCAYPKTAHYKGAGDAESADSFECR